MMMLMYMFVHSRRFPDLVEPRSPPWIPAHELFSLAQDAQSGKVL